MPFDAIDRASSPNVAGLPRITPLWGGHSLAEETLTLVPFAGQRQGDLRGSPR
jgi:hypothetical protein